MSQSSAASIENSSRITKMQEQPSSTGSGFRVWGPALLSALLGAPLVFRTVGEGDAGWHLALGRLIVSGDFPRRNALSWTHPDEPWYPTSWLFDVTGYALASVPGLGDAGGLQVLTCLFLGLTLTGAALAAHQVARGHGAVLLPLLTLFLWPRITPRPHMATWAVMAFVLALCLRGQRERLDRFDERTLEGSPTTRWRLWCLPIIALGSNLHSGAAFASIILGVFCLEAFALEGRRFRELLVGAAAVAALTANPGGFFNLAYLVDHLTVQSVIRLEEFQRPTLAAHGPLLALVVVALGLSAREIRRRPALFVVGLGFLVLGLRTDRLVYKATLVGFPALALALPRLQRLGRTVFTRGLPALATLLLLSFRLPLLENVSFGPRLDASTVPIRAADFIEANGIEGRSFNSFRDGGYLAWRFPDRPVFQDARVQAYPPSFFQAEQEAERRPDRFREWLRELDVEWALTTRLPERLGGFRSLNAPDWALVYWDDVSEVWLRRDVPRFGELIARNEFRFFRPYGAILRPIAAADRTTLEQWRAEVERSEALVSNDSMALLVKCAVEIRLGASSADHSCERAWDEATDERTARLLLRARGLTVAAQ